MCVCVCVKALLCRVRLLDLLYLSSLFLLFFSSPPPRPPHQERALWDGLVKLYKEGYVSAVGVSNYGPKQVWERDAQVG